MNSWLPIVLGVLGAALSALAAFAIARRQRSGKIDTSEASELWDEGKAMRLELRAETVTLRREVLALQTEAVAARAESTSLRAELTVLRKESAETHAAMATLREECAALHLEIVALRTQMAGEQAGREALTAKLDDSAAEGTTS